MRNKLWLCGMWRGNRERLEKSIDHIHKYFDGIIAVVDSRIESKDWAWLESIKGGGEIIVKKWVNDHAHTSNEVLLSGVMEWPDYFVWIDETDQLKEDFVKSLPERIASWRANDVGMVYLDHPFVIRFNCGLRFVGSPHWGFAGTIGKTVALSQLPNYNKEHYLINNRDLLHSGFLNTSKYWFSYPNFSNHTVLLYRQFGEDIYNYHESVRIQFRMFCKEVLGIKLTIDSLVDYMRSNIGRYPDYFENVLEAEIALKDIFRLKVLNRPMQELIDNRFNWSFFKWKNEGAALQGRNDGYVGLFNKYNARIGKPQE